MRHLLMLTQHDQPDWGFNAANLTEFWHYSLGNLVDYLLGRPPLPLFDFTAPPRRGVPVPHRPRTDRPVDGGKALVEPEIGGRYDFGHPYRHPEAFT